MNEKQLAEDNKPIRLSTPSRAARKMPRRSRAGHCGTIVAFPDRRRIEHESELEAKVAVVLIATPEVVDLREQLPALSYIDADGEMRSTCFDFLATLRDGARVAISVKPSAVAERTRHEDDLALIASQTPVQFATHVRMMTERDVPEDAVYNARLVLSVRSDPICDAANVIAALANDLEGSIRIDRLGEASGLDGRSFRAIVRCIDLGVLQVLTTGRIGPSTCVRRAARR